MLSKELDFLTVSEAAELIGVTEGRVRQLLKSGDLLGEKFGTQWVITRAEVDRFAQIPPPAVGRPRSSSS
ncbi:hypothetical protein LCGC14_1258770 [marine sediment metagenome]|uniref:Helix-turn-helix domain-containing protein n=1 Tax=marine sediment metagenome TaxID=412755 RepID=A0A0F9P4N6_9ZZZZ